MPWLESLIDSPHICMASGAEVIIRFMIEYDTTPQITATTKRGWRATTRSGRPPLRSAGGGGGASTPASTAIAINATIACTANENANRNGGQRSMVHCTSCGPSTPANTPPAITRAMARGR